MYWLASTIMSPVLLAQGIRTRSRTPRLPEPPGRRSGFAGTGRALRLLIAGDSAAAGVGASHLNDALSGRLLALLSPSWRVAWRIVAKTGATTSSCQSDLQALPPEPFDVAVTSLGVNDLTRGSTIRRWLFDQAKLRSLLRDRFKVKLIVVSGMPPVHKFPALPQPLRWHLGRRARQLDRTLQADIAGESDCVFVSLDIDGDNDMMASDGFHPGPPVYALWAAQVSDRVNENLKLE